MNMLLSTRPSEYKQILSLVRSSYLDEVMIIFFISSILEEAQYLALKADGKFLPVYTKEYPKPILNKRFQDSNFTILARHIQDGIFTAENFKSIKGYRGNLMAGEDVRILLDSTFNNFSEYQLAAIKEGISPYNFVVFDPTEYAVNEGYIQFVYPLKEGLAKIEEYKAEGLNQLFYITIVNC